MKIPDQKTMWNRKHGAGEHAGFRDDQSSLAHITAKYLKPKSTILELGCGNGRDSVYFDSLGNNVLATDFSKTIIAQNIDLFNLPTVKFEVFEIQKKFKFDDASFDAIYANLSLHYFLDAKTKEIFSEIHRVLKAGGVFAFSCKSSDSVRLDNATEVEKNVYVGKNGHALHVFSIEYCRELLRQQYEILYLDEINEEYVSRASGVIRCIAKKTL